MLEGPAKFVPDFNKVALFSQILSRLSLFTFLNTVVFFILEFLILCCLPFHLYFFIQIDTTCNFYYYCSFI